ncbi:VCBS repeat-containing protein [Algoriphagus boritolerans]|uniref:FG-GAP repeat domain-containing protein n=1 Tax=Algoriphagus boritolerans TaxID=308111 RepID=UPI002FCE1750
MKKISDFFHYLDTVPFQYSHQENDFNEVFHENLNLRRFSSEGPGISIGDVNNDGLEDVFLTNAQNFKDRLFIQQKDGSFYEIYQEAFEKDSLYEGVDAIFFRCRR